MRAYPFDSLAAYGLHAYITIFAFSGPIYLTTYFQDVVRNGITYKARGGTNVTQIVYSSDGTPAAADIRVSPDNLGIFASWGARGYLEGLPIKLEIFDTGSPALGAFDMIPGMVIGSCGEDTDGNIILGAQGRLAILKSNMLEVHTITCKAVFGDDRCQIPLDVPVVARNTAYITQAQKDDWEFTRQVWARVFQSSSFNNLVYECTTQGTTHPTVQPTYPTVAGGTVLDGTAVFTARAARLVAATGSALDFFTVQLSSDPGLSDPLPLGKIIPQTGPLAGIKIPIKDFDSGTLVVTLFEPFAPSAFPTGTSFLIHPGCDKLFSTCQAYSNGRKFRGLPYGPNSDAIDARA
ncbi:phage BR0599 family protein [Bradyrhizobium sp. Arg62]|uniref:phage BR0599 family protein n=1 Tax=Bradyrhizobium brasilense TaxID=1419277 RepID=UPI001E47907D|nr:phage BR0599 family protein [Bradyrhizobium brasilense]MCC8946017.1 phage BR0599 family protein [Bradyrhizobium brasilense]